ncbi:hypothetical protein E4U43_005822 [Claviceps pusilla]|uniref:BZIP domain-containing protein n=1 Tax=Claviceps pusilla TaxID=123648 RepID=A0A9P7NG63_9HYPO|nr:hypothetical protein E4U43_005822 [Claviceps pusilla]
MPLSSIMPHQGHAASLPQMTSPAAARKRSRPADEDDVKVNESTEDDGQTKRCRGRPRKDTKDETAADISDNVLKRRRTQIRLAQRAYRHRKDAAITTLEKRVQELEKANNDISKNFDAFFGILVSERLLEGAPQTLQRLSSIANKIAAAADKARVSNGDVSASDDDDDEAPIIPSKQLPAQDALQRKASLQQADYPTTFQVPAAAEALASYSGPLIYAPHSVNYDVVTAAAQQNVDLPFYSSMESGTAADFQENLTTMPSPHHTLHVPYSFAACEQTFGRRLQRFTCESALRLITSTSPSPDRFAAVFGFCMLFETREEIIRRLQAILNSRQDEDLCFWKYPFTNLGGAGTFFPDQSSMRSPNSASGSRGGSSMPIGNQDTQSYAKPQQMTGMSMGPWGPAVAVQKARDEQIDYGHDRRMRMMLVGFEGDFCDPDEVETHLRQLGIFVPPRADFVDAEIDVFELGRHGEAPGLSNGFVLQPQQAHHRSADSTYGSSVMNATGSNSNGSSASGPTGSPCSPSNPFMAEYAGMIYGQPPFSEPGPALVATAAPAPAPAPAPASGNDFSSTATTPYAVSSPTGNCVWPQPTHWSNKVKITLDVGMLIKELTRKSVCLGRSPGVRRKHVIHAVKIAAGLVAGSG